MLARRHVSLSDYLEQLVARQVDQLELQELNEALNRRINELPICERDALTAYARIGDQTCREVAARYGKSPQAVYGWAHSACRKLRPLLEAVR